MDNGRKNELWRKHFGRDYFTGYSKQKAKQKRQKKRKQSRDPLPRSLRRSLDATRGKSYKEFLKSDYWHWIRAQVLTRDKHKCILCPETKGLEVHHQTYRHHFKEHKHLDDLTTLCGDCHQEVHMTFEITNQPILSGQ